jgi:cytochrome c peroxidase
MTNRHLQLTRRTLMAAAALLLSLSAGKVQATNHEVHIDEVMAGANGNSKIQFIVLRQEEIGQNLWGPTNGTQSAAMLVFFDATGRETGKFKFPANPPTAGTLKTLIATQEFANLPGAPRPDVIIPPLVNPISGQVCFRNNPQNAVFARNECLSYGNFTGDTGINFGGFDGNVPAGPPASALPIMNTVSLRRTVDTSRNSDFTINTNPTPINIAGATFTMAVAAQAVQGENLFNNETFQGNGRTCASCHVQSESFRFPPSNAQSRFTTLSTTFDPQFIGETAPTSFDAGFDFNLNKLVLTTTTVGTPPTPVAILSNAPCTGELRGIITSAGGARGKVLTRISDTTYLVYGGINPPLSGTVSDSNGCSGTVAGITPGDLNGLEDPLRMRTSRDSDFPQGRALIKENIDGFGNPAVFRKSPHLLNLSRTAPFGFSGDIPDLETFTAGAVRQHFPRSLARAESGTNPDFRIPTPDELAAMREFMLAQEFPPGNDPNKFDLDRFVTTPAEQRGRDAFFGPVAKCSMCHGGPVLAQMTAVVLGQGIGVNGRFNTGVVNQPINSPGVDDLPCEGSPCGSREFSVPQLFNAKNLGPFFHDGSAATLRKAVEFYDSLTFNNSPAGVAIGGISLAGISSTAVDDITAFLQGLTFQSISANSATNVTGSTGGAASPLPSVRVLDKNGNPLPGVSVTFAVTSGGGTLSGAVQTTDASGVATIGNWILGAGPSSVTATAAGSFAGNPVTFTAVPLPTLSSITPNNASRGVTVAVTLAGSNFLLGATTVAVNGTGVTVSNVGVVSPTSISARFTVAPDAPQGGRSVTVTTAGGTSAASTFSINVPGPGLNTLSPTSGAQGTSVVVTLSGNNFFPGDTTIAITGPGVTISNINVSSLTAMSATFAIASDAPLGARNVTVMTSGGTSAPRTFTITGPPPTLTSTSPNTGAQNTSVNVTLTGTNFVPGGTTINPGGGVAVNNTNVVSASSMTATFVIAPEAQVGARNVTVTTGNGTSNPVVFTVLPGVPILSGISPSFGVVGNSVDVTLNGSMFVLGATTIAISGAGVTLSNTNVVSTTQITATFAVASNATLGPRSVTVTTTGGTSGAATFNVFDPFPDLTVSSTHAGTFAPGFNETYSLAVSNAGTVASSSAITVTDTLPSGMSLVSASGVSWTCAATGQIVICTRSLALAAGSAPSITLTVAVAESPLPSVNNIVTVSTAEDLNPSNNTANDTTAIASIPGILAVVSPIVLTPGQQGSVQLSLTAPFSHDITGTLSLAFVPSAAIPLDDPAIQLATGGRQLAFTFPANTTQARFAGQFQPSPVGFQPGTVAGTLSFGGTLTVGSIQKTFTALNGTRTIVPAPPQIRATKTTQQPGGFTATITLMSVTREVIDLTLTFNTSPAIKLTCAGLAGCTANGSTITFNVKQIFDGWYASDTTFGSLSTLTLPFTIQGGTVRGTVNISLRNTMGLSNTMGFNLP